MGGREAARGGGACSPGGRSEGWFWGRGDGRLRDRVQGQPPPSARRSCGGRGSPEGRSGQVVGREKERGAITAGGRGRRPAAASCRVRLVEEEPRRRASCGHLVGHLQRRCAPEPSPLGRPPASSVFAAGGCRGVTQVCRAGSCDDRVSRSRVSSLVPRTCRREGPAWRASFPSCVVFQVSMSPVAQRQTRAS